MKWVDVVQCALCYAPRTIHCKPIRSPCKFSMHRFQFCQIVDCSIWPNENFDTEKWSSNSSSSSPFLILRRNYFSSSRISCWIWNEKKNEKFPLHMRKQSRSTMFVARFKILRQLRRTTHPRTLLIILHGGFECKKWFAYLFFLVVIFFYFHRGVIITMRKAYVLNVLTHSLSLFS